MASLQQEADYQHLICNFRSFANSLGHKPPLSTDTAAVSQLYISDEMIYHIFSSKGLFYERVKRVFGGQKGFQTSQSLYIKGREVFKVFGETLDATKLEAAKRLVFTV